MKKSRSPLLVLALGVCGANAAFNLLTGFDAMVQANLGISTKCMAAINTTIQCDEANAKMAAMGMDENYWYKENITALCTTQCRNSMTSWLSLVSTDCATDTITQAGIVVQAKSIPLQYTHNVDLACLQDSASAWCFPQSQTWRGSEYVRYDPYMCYQDNPPAICNDPDFDVSAVDPTLQSITGLYSKSLYCSECFLKVWRQRLVSPFLTPGNWTQYRINQFDSLQTNCSTTMAYTTSSNTLFINTVTATPTPTPSLVNSTAATPTCTGQVVPSPAIPLSCNELSDQYNVTTGDLMVITKDSGCQFNSAICLPPPCKIKVIESYTDSCPYYERLLSNATNTVTHEQFMAWNPNIQGSCDSLAIDQRICMSPQGGFWVSNSTIIAPPSGTPVYQTTATPAWPTQSGSIQDCGRYHQVVDGDTCNLVCLIYGITFSTLRKFNTYLNVDCTNLWLKSSVCVGQVKPKPVSTDGTCGPNNNDAICAGSGFGSCCSVNGWCGDTVNHCSASSCYSGACTSGSTATTDGSCGPNAGGLTCTNPNFGPCCSVYGWCGSGNDFCGTGHCYSGSCDPQLGGPSTTGECGPLFQGNKTCSGTQFGGCCSAHGYCGSTDDYCKGANCYSGACTQ